MSAGTRTSHPVFMVSLCSNKLKASINAVACVDQFHQASRACPVKVSLSNTLILAAAAVSTLAGDGKEGKEVGSPVLWVRNLCIGPKHVAK
jgi:hypothetical protein